MVYLPAFTWPRRAAVYRAWVYFFERATDCVASINISAGISDWFSTISGFSHRARKGWRRSSRQKTDHRQNDEAAKDHVMVIQTCLPLLMAGTSLAFSSRRAFCDWLIHAFAHAFVRARLCAGLHNFSVRARRFHDFAPFPNIVGNRLLNINILARLNGPDRRE